MNPFGPYNASGAMGFSYRGADHSMPNSDSEYDNLSYVAFLVRNFNTGGVAANLSSNSGGLTYNGVCT